MTLYVIGIGLFDEKDISVRGLDFVKQCDYLYLENYTSLMKATKEDLEKFYGKEIISAERELVEQSDEIVERAKTKNVGVLVMGDPLTATTHLALLMTAKENNVETIVVHNASVISAVGATGLQPYKFGKMVTVPFPDYNYRPESYYHVIRQNQTLGLHTLLLLDLKPVDKKFMSVTEAIDLLEQIESNQNIGVITPQTMLIACARLGWPDQKIVYGTPSQIKNMDLPSPPHALVVPGQLHFSEEDALKEFLVEPPRNS